MTRLSISIWINRDEADFFSLNGYNVDCFDNAKSFGLPSAISPAPRRTFCRSNCTAKGSTRGKYDSGSEPINRLFSLSRCNAVPKSHDRNVPAMLLESGRLLLILLRSTSVPRDSSLALAKFYDTRYICTYTGCKVIMGFSHGITRCISLIRAMFVLGLFKRRKYRVNLWNTLDFLSRFERSDYV